MLVLWSGGCDSTLVLNDLIQENPPFERDGEWVYPVKALSLNVPEVHNSTFARAARNAIAAKWADKGMYCRREELTVSYDMELHHHHILDAGNIQAQLWLALAVPYLDHDEDLYLGWVKDDVVWHDTGAIHEVFRGMSTLAGRNVGTSGRLMTPLEWTNKREVILRLKSAGLYDLTWWCEEPENAVDRFCDMCTPCQTHRTAQWQIERFSGERLLKVEG